MQRPKQKRTLWQQMKRVPKYMYPSVFIALVSVFTLIIASVQAFTPGRACVTAPSSPYPSMEVVSQKGNTRFIDKTVTNQHLIGCISDDLRHLPELPNQGVICPVTDSTTYILSFDGGKIVTGSLSGCQSVKIQGDDKIYYLLPNTSYTKDMRSKLHTILQ